MISEYDAFKSLTDGLGQAADAAKALAYWRPDQRNMWEKLAQAFKVNQEAAFRLAGEGAVQSKPRVGH